MRAQVLGIIQVAVMLFAAFIVLVPLSAFAEQGKSVVFLLDRDCSADYEATLRGAIAYRNYLDPDFEVACSPTFGILGISGIENVMVPILRFFYPNDLFVFVYPESMERQFYDYILNHYADEFTPLTVKALLQGTSGIAGDAVIEKGFALSSENPNAVRHEMFHLQSCSLHIDDNDEPEQWYRHPLADQLAWCPQ